MNKTFLSQGITDMQGTRGAPQPTGNSLADADGHVGAPPILLQYWHAALRRKWVILAILLLALAAGVVITLLSRPQYVASAQIEISRDERNPTKIEGIDGEASMQDQEFYQTQYTLLESRSLAERVAQQLSLANNPAFYEAHDLEPPPAANDARAKVREAGNLLLAHVEVVPVTRSRLVNLRYTSGDPELSARIANAWVENYIQATSDRRFAATVGARKFLEGRLAELGVRLEESERKAAEFASEKGIVPLNTTISGDGRTQTQQTLAAAQLSSLADALAEATADRIAAQSRSTSGVNASIVENQTVSSLRQQRAEVSAEYAQLLEKFEPEFPEARAMKNRIDSLDRAITSEESRVNGARSSGFAEAARREATLREQVALLSGRLNQENRDEIQYNIFLRDADTTRQLYDSLLQSYKEIGVAGIGANNISIVDRAEVPTSPSSPVLLVNLLVALLLGLFLAGLIVVILEQIDEGLREPADVRRQLNLPFLGSIPMSAEEDVVSQLGDPKSELSEAYLSVQTSLAFATDHGVPHSLMVTSSRPAEGKSLTAYALASVLARTGKSVILVDGDMRSPSVHELDGTGNARGLSNALAGDADWAAHIHQNSTNRFAILTAGPTPPSAAELLSGPRFALVIEQLGQQYDHVVIDAPPVLGLADAPIISRAVEASVFVVEANGVAVRGLRSAIGRLRQSQANIVGAVLTKLAREGFGYGYGYGYGHTYGYGRQADDRVAAE